MNAAAADQGEDSIKLAKVQKSKLSSKAPPVSVQNTNVNNSIRKKKKSTMVHYLPTEDDKKYPNFLQI